MKEFKPTTTQYPNFLFEIMPSLKEGELRLLNAIVRKTYGYGKSEDRISLSQMIKLTGLSKQGILDAREGLLTKKIIATKMVNGITEYVVLVPDDAPVYEVDAQNLDGNKVDVKIKQEPSQNQTDEPVKILDTQKKEEQNKNTKEIETVLDSSKEKTHEWENPKQFPHLKENFVPKYSIADFTNDIDKKLLLDDALKRFYDVVLKKPYASRKPHLAPQVMERIDPNKCVYSQIWSICYKFPLEDFWKTYNPDIGYLESAWSKLDNIPLPKWMELGYENEYLYEQAHRRPYEPHPFFQERKEAMGGPSATVEQFEEVFSNFDEIFRAKEKEYAKP